MAGSKKKAGKKAGKKQAGKKVAKKAAKKAGKKVAKKAAKKAGKKPAKKAAKKKAAKQAPAKKQAGKKQAGKQPAAKRATSTPAKRSSRARVREVIGPDEPIAFESPDLAVAGDETIVFDAAEAVPIREAEAFAPIDDGSFEVETPAFDASEVVIEAPAPTSKVDIPEDERDSETEPTLAPEAADTPMAISAAETLGVEEPASPIEPVVEHMEDPALVLEELEHEGEHEVHPAPTPEPPPSEHPKLRVSGPAGAQQGLEHLPQASRQLLDELGAAARHALEHLRTLGVDHAEVSVSQGERLEAGVRQGEVELIKEAKSRGLSVRVVHGERVAASSTTDLGSEAVERFLARVVEMAELSEPDPLADPPDPDELTRSFPTLDLWDSRIAAIKADEALELALAGERAALAYSDKISASEGASVSRTASHTVLATSGGFVGMAAGTYASLVVAVVADDEGGKKRNGYHWTGARHFEDLLEPTAIGREAGERAVRALGSVKLETGVYPVVFDHEAAGAIVGLLASCILGDSVYREQSYLGARLGTKIASELVTIVDDPLLARGPGSRRYDGEGRAVRRNVVVDAGTLRSFLLDTYSSRKLKLPPTGSGGGGGGVPHATTSNFFMLPGAHTRAELLQGIERGLYVTSMMGFGFDPVTGNFSRGASGFLIEDGKLSTPVSEITISRNLDELLQGIDAVADDLEHRSSTASPSFRVDRMTISGR